MMEIAQPIGPIFGIIPITNPTSTVLFKILISLKSRNPIIFSAPRRAPECCRLAAEICYKAAIEAGAPEDCIQILPETNRELTQEIMANPKLALILATGGTGLVHAAYSLGNPSMGVGSGNVPILIDVSADIPFAVKNIIDSETFDNGTICASEQSVVCEKKIAQQVIAEFEKQGCCFLNEDEITKIEAIAFNKEKGVMGAAVVGQPVSKIAKMAGINTPEGARILIATQEHIGLEYPLSQEILAPILAFFEAPDYQSAVKMCIDLNYLGGVGHTVGIYSNNEDRILGFSTIMNAGRIIVNTPSVQGAVGGIFNVLPTLLTLGCGTSGKNITTENVTALHLINIQRVCKRRVNEKWIYFDQSKYMDESLDISKILNEYNKNY